jgi:negative regulator of sigma-B (phosphoserine phosphatase)
MDAMMRMEIAARRAPLLVGVACRALPGELASGDLHLVKETPEGMLVAVVDGVGHGEEAASAARWATEAIRAYQNEPLVSLVAHCHQTLAGTRGAVISLAAFDIGRETMSWLGVGNVEGALLCAGERGMPVRNRLLLRNGVVGHTLPTLEASEVPVAPGDLLVLATDGICPDFADTLIRGEAPQRSADRILAEYARDTDDALVLVARYRG